MDYREFLSQALRERRRHEPGFTQAALAERAGIRNTYLTNVLKGRANFNSDQLYAVSRELKLANAESEYLFLLKEWDQCLNPERKAALREELEKRRSKALTTEGHLKAKVRRDEHETIMRYYSDPAIKIVHVFLQVARFAQDPASIAEVAGIGTERLEAIFATLQDLGIVAFEKKKAVVLQKNFHLPKDSPMLLPHQTLMRTLATQRLVELPPDQRYSLAVTFSATEETRRKLHARFLEFLKEAEGLVKGSKSEAVYQMNFDLFPWIKRS